ncbi:MAG: hypothetical protein WBA42_01350 [Mesorhizobium sp.]
MKAILILIVSQYLSAGQIAGTEQNPNRIDFEKVEMHVNAPSIVYFGSMETCEKQREFLISSLKDSFTGPLSLVGHNARMMVKGRCVPVQ